MATRSAVFFSLLTLAACGSGGGGGGGGGGDPFLLPLVTVCFDNTAPVPIVGVRLRLAGATGYDPAVDVWIDPDATDCVFDLLENVYDFRAEWEDGTADELLGVDLYGLGGTSRTVQPNYAPTPAAPEWVEEDTSYLQWGAITGFAVREGVLTAAGWVTPNSNIARSRTGLGYQVWTSAPAIWEKTPTGWHERMSETFDASDPYVDAQFECRKPAASSVAGVVAPELSGGWGWMSDMMRTWDGISSPRVTVPLPYVSGVSPASPVLGGAGALPDGSVIVPWFNLEPHTAMENGGILRWDPIGDTWTREWTTTAYKAPLASSRKGTWVAGLVPGDTSMAALLLHRNANGTWTEQPAQTLTSGGPADGRIDWYEGRFCLLWEQTPHVGRVEESAQGRVMVVGYSGAGGFALERAAGSSSWLATSLPADVVELGDVAFDGETAWAAGFARIGSGSNMRAVVLRRDPGPSAAWEEVTVPPAPAEGMWMAVEVVEGTVWLGGWRFEPYRATTPVIVSRGPASGSGDDGDDHADTADAGRTVLRPSVTPGSIETENDEDWFRLPVTAGQTYTLRTVLGTLPDSVLEVFTGNGASLLASNDDDPAGGLQSRLLYTPTVATTLAIRVRPYDPTQTGTYSLVVE